MVTALVDDKPDFVKLFFNEGLSLRQFLTVEVLISLYEQVINYLISITPIARKKLHDLHVTSRS